MPCIQAGVSRMFPPQDGIALVAGDPLLGGVRGRLPAMTSHHPWWLKPIPNTKKIAAAAAKSENAGKSKATARAGKREKPLSETSENPFELHRGIETASLRTEPLLTNALIWRASTRTSANSKVSRNQSVDPVYGGYGRAPKSSRRCPRIRCRLDHRSPHAASTKDHFRKFRKFVLPGTALPSSRDAPLGPGWAAGGSPLQSHDRRGNRGNRANLRNPDEMGIGGRTSRPAANRANPRKPAFAPASDRRLPAWATSRWAMPRGSRL